MEIHEKIRPTNSDEDIVDESSLVRVCSGAALVKATQSSETISSVLGEGPMVGGLWHFVVRLKESIVSFSLEKE